MPRRLAHGTLPLAALLIAGIARAGDPVIAPSPQSSVSARGSAAPAISTDPAQALFDAGLADMEAGRFEKACPAIEASQRMDPRPGTLFTLAECEAQRGRAATAMRYYAEYLGLYRNLTPAKKNEQRDRAKTSEDQLRKLELLAPRLTIVIASGGGPDVVVKRDGEVVAELSLGTALPVDPGDHVITAQAPDGAESTVRVTIAPGESKTAQLSLAHAKPAPTVNVAPPPPQTTAVPFSQVQRPWRIATVTTTAIGVLGIVTGIATGVVALQMRAAYEKECEVVGAEQQCTQRGLNLVERLRPFATASTVAFAAGGLGLAVGLTLFVATPSLPTKSPGGGTPPTAVLPGGEIGVHVGGRF